jgi:polyhydroxybutyrate depolymerase
LSAACSSGGGGNFDLGLIIHGPDGGTTADVPTAPDAPGTTDLAPGLDQPAPEDVPVTASPDATTGPSDGGPHDFIAADAASPFPLVQARPYPFYVPGGYDPATPAPLVMLLHGHAPGQDGQAIESYFQLVPVAEANTFLYVAPNGLMDSTGVRFWNATDACCDFDNTGVDDVAYLGQVIDDMSARYNVDPARIYVGGFSNGAFMAHRLGCDLADRLAAVISVSGATWNDPSRCQPAANISVLEIHGTADMNVLYDGGNIAAPYPGAETTIAIWGQKNGCTGQLADTGQRADLDTQLAGQETVIGAVGGCPEGIDVGLWAIQGAAHAPNFPSTFGQTLYDFWSAHTR